MPTPEERLAYLRGSLDEEIEDVMEKLPWYERAAIAIAIGVASGAALVACGVVTVGTAGGGALPCALAVIALIAALINLLVERGAAVEEREALQEKNEQMEALVAELEGN